MKTRLRLVLALALAGAALLGWWLLPRSAGEAPAPAAPRLERPAAGGASTALAPPRAVAGDDGERARAAAPAGLGEVELRVELERGCVALERPALRLRPADADQPLAARGPVWRVPAGTYDLLVEGTAWRSASHRVALRDGAAATVLDVRPESLSRFTGRVLDRATLLGVPRFSLQVETLRELLPLESTRLHRDVELAGDGSFCIEGVSLAPQIRFHVRAPGYEPWTSPWSAFEAAPRRDDLVFLLQASAPVLVELRGRVFGEGGPIAGAEVRWIDAGAGPTELAVLDGSVHTLEDAGPRSVARTGQDGGFVLHAAAPRAVRLIAYHPEHLLAQEGPFELVPGQGPLLVDLALERGAAVHGQVRLAEEQRERQRPTAVYLQGPTPVRAIELDAELRYRAAGLGPGGYVLVLHGMEALPAGGETLVPIASRTVALEPFEEAVVDFDLLAEAAGGTVSGLARLPEGASAWPCHVALCGASLASGPVRSGLVAQDGRFELGPAPDGDYLVVFAAQAHDSTRGCFACVPVVLREGRAVELGPLDLDVPRVRLRRAGAGRQAAGTPVHVSAHEVDPRFAELLELELRATLDGEGTCELSGLPPGRYYARLEGSAASAELRIEPGFAGTLEVALP